MSPRCPRAATELRTLVSGILREGAPVMVPLLCASSSNAGTDVLHAAVRAGAGGGGEAAPAFVGYAAERSTWLCNTLKGTSSKLGANAGVRGGVSYAMFCGGTTDQKSFKPSKDDSQWWGRRDALCRSVAACLWGAGGRPYQHVHECCLLFDDRGVFGMDGKRFAAGIGVPKEKSLIRAWRDAALGTPGEWGRATYPNVASCAPC